MELTWNGEPSGEPSGEPRGEAEAPGGRPPRGVIGGDSRAEDEGNHEAEALRHNLALLIIQAGIQTMQW
jgi:hypothetical protein